MADSDDRVSLKMPIDQALAKLQGHIQTGKEQASEGITNEAQLQNALARYRRWRDYAKTLLANMFTDNSIADELEYGRVVNLEPNLEEKIADYRDDYDRDINILISIEERLPLIAERTSETTSPAQHRDNGHWSVDSHRWQAALVILGVLLTIALTIVAHHFKWI